MRYLALSLCCLLNCRFTATPDHPGTAIVGVPFQATVVMGRSDPTENATGWGCVGHPLGWTATATADVSATLVPQDPTAVVNKPSLPADYGWTCWDLRSFWSTVTATVVLTPSTEGDAVLTWFVESQSGTGSDTLTTSVWVSASDEDQDGAMSTAAGGGDCDDTRPDVYPGALETCDGVDNDCDAVVDDVPVSPLWYLDNDADGVGNAWTAVARCEPPGPGWTDVGGDCNDRDPWAYPGAPERCDGIDNNCNFVVDDVTVPPLWYADIDADGVGDAWTGLAQCERPAPDWTDLAGDCDDQDPWTYPGAPEQCDGVDNDCDAAVDDDAPDADADGVCDAFDLLLTATPIVPGQSVTFTISHAAPGARAAILISRSSGGPPRCLPGFSLANGAPACVDLVRPTVLGPAVVGPSGTATWTVLVPATFRPGQSFAAVGAVWADGLADMTPTGTFTTQ